MNKKPITYLDEILYDDVRLQDLSDLGIQPALVFLDEALTAGKHDAFASNKFMVEEAIHFVEKLITAGVLEAYIPIAFDEEDGPYGDTLWVRLPSNGLTTTLKRVIYNDGDPDEVGAYPNIWEPQWMCLWWD